MGRFDLVHFLNPLACFAQVANLWGSLGWLCFRTLAYYFFVKCAAFLGFLVFEALVFEALDIYRTSDRIPDSVLIFMMVASVVFSSSIADVWFGPAYAGQLGSSLEATADVLGMVGVLCVVLSTSLCRKPVMSDLNKSLSRMLNISLNLFVTYQIWEKVGDEEQDPKGVADELWFLLSILNTLEITLMLTCIGDIHGCEEEYRWYNAGIDVSQIVLEATYASIVAGEETTLTVISINVMQTMAELKG
eukprot:TRINITY_DN30662_c0_g1_i1.p1 TRINITY_DN30662_c0_g1~~TRINITY_DN30662_c0_g1_i1.p1  ORF type:complete len:247 (-),score=23.22 TRINITY_DN30662_c0_g1_i1:70-810(-)